MVYSQMPPGSPQAGLIGSLHLVTGSQHSAFCLEVLFAYCVNPLLYLSKSVPVTKSHGSLLFLQLITTQWKVILLIVISYYVIIKNKTKTGFWIDQNHFYYKLRVCKNKRTTTKKYTELLKYPYWIPLTSSGAIYQNSLAFRKEKHMHTQTYLPAVPLRSPEAWAFIQISIHSSKFFCC